MSKHWIAGAISHPGALHKTMGIPMDKKIPMSKLEAASHMKGMMGKRARPAMTLRHFKGASMHTGWLMAHKARCGIK